MRKLCSSPNVLWGEASSLLRLCWPQGLLATCAFFLGAVQPVESCKRGRFACYNLISATTTYFGTRVLQIWWCMFTQKGIESQTSFLKVSNDRCFCPCSSHLCCATTAFDGVCLCRCLGRAPGGDFKSQCGAWHLRSQLSMFGTSWSPYIQVGCESSAEAFPFSSAKLLHRLRWRKDIGVAGSGASLRTWSRIRSNRTQALNQGSSEACNLSSFVPSFEKVDQKRAQNKSSGSVSCGRCCSKRHDRDTSQPVDSLENAGRSHRL